MKPIEKILWVLIAILFAVLTIVNVVFADARIVVAKTANVANDETDNGNDLTVSGATASSTHYIEGSYSILRDATDDSVYRTASHQNRAGGKITGGRNR